MKITYRPAAINDIRATADYIEKELHNPRAASRFKENILHSVSHLKDNPKMGKLLSEKYDAVKNEYRYIIVDKQLVFYEITGGSVEIIRVLDGRTDYLTHLF